MIISLLATQLVSFAVVVIAPPPFPPVFVIEEIADFLRARSPEPPGLKTHIAVDGGPLPRNPRETQLRAALAGRLGVPLDQVRLMVGDPVTGASGPPLTSPGGTIALGRHMMGRDRVDGMRDEIIFGKFSAALRQPDGRWRVVASPSQVLDPWQWRALAWLVGTVLAVSVPAYVLARRLAAPIAEFAAAAERLGRDPSAPPLAIAGPTEILALAAAFNRMQARLQRYVHDRTQMIGAIAHDLRTPLMRLSYVIEDAPADLRARADREIDEMRGMIGVVLDFVRDRFRSDARARIDLRSLVESIAQNHLDAGADVSLAPGEAIVIEGDLVGLRSVFANLIGNAVKYGATARVRIERADGQAMVRIDDDGAGLGEADLERVFEPFYRAEPSRNRNTGGIGLGLAIVRTVARGHGGEVTLRNRPEGGLCAEVSLPLHIN